MNRIVNPVRVCLRDAGRCAVGAGLVLLGLAASSPAQTNNVTECTETALRSALAEGGTIHFNCDGTITLTETLSIATNTLLDAGSHRVTINGGGSVPILRVAPNVSLTAMNLTIANGSSDHGAGLYNDGGRVTLQNCVFANNTAAGWAALGGAIYNEGVLSVDASLFYSNSAAGADGVDGASPSPVYDPVADNPATPGGPGGAACGAIFNTGTATLVNCTFVGNHARAGRGGKGGDGGIIYEIVPITDPPTPPRWRYGTDGAGGDGGDGIAAVQSVGGVCFLTNCTFALNWCDVNGGWGGEGGMGNAMRGPAPPGANGEKIGGIFGACGLINTLLATNTPDNGGGLDLGHNLSSDGSSGFTHPASLNNADPRLGPLAPNGGPTLTIALLWGSPAIDAADPMRAPRSDQRGFPRPVGPAPDIGAFEYGPPAFLQLDLASESDSLVRLFGMPGHPFSLLTSTNLSTWSVLATNQLGLDGTALFHHDRAAPCRFFRLALP